MPESKEQVEEFEPEQENGHGHLCLLYESEAELVTPVIPFIQQGVAHGERCVYLNAGEGTLERLLNTAVAAQKHDIGALVLLPAGESWLKDGYFNPQRVMDLLHALSAKAQDDGFKGVRIICDMGWAGSAGLREAALLEFEQALNLFVERNDVALLCLYHRGSFSEPQLLGLARLHQHLMIEGKACVNPYYVPKDREAGEARPAGELDLFLAAARAATGAASDRERLRQEREQAYAALARKIYESWQEEDTLRASEKELQEKEEALSEQRRRLQTVLQHLPAMLIALDGGNRLTACNHEFERVTGYRPEEVMGKPLSELLEVAAEVREELVLAHPPDGGDYRARQWPLRCKDGSLRTGAWSNFSRYVRIAGWPNWIVGIDLTATVAAEVSLRLLQEELQARNGELEALGQAISHQLGGRIAEINRHCEILQELYGIALSPPCRKIVEEIHRVAREMAGRVCALKRLDPPLEGRLRPENVAVAQLHQEMAVHGVKE